MYEPWAGRGRLSLRAGGWVDQCWCVLRCGGSGTNLLVFIGGMLRTVAGLKAWRSFSVAVVSQQTLCGSCSSASPPLVRGTRCLPAKQRPELTQNVRIGAGTAPQAGVCTHLCKDLRTAADRVTNAKHATRKHFRRCAHETRIVRTHHLLQPRPTMKNAKTWECVTQNPPRSETLGATAGDTRSGGSGGTSSAGWMISLAETRTEHAINGPTSTNPSEVALCQTSVGLDVVMDPPTKVTTAKKTTNTNKTTRDDHAQLDALSCMSLQSAQHRPGMNPRSSQHCSWYRSLL